jgi:glycosyltransferase involved in cell wall biosynthesis
MKVGSAMTGMTSADAAEQARVLIVVPTLGRRPAFLAQTLQSIREQKGESADIVVVVPPDAVEARQLAKEWGADIADDPGSLSAAVNVGWEFALPRHRYVNWIGDDDLLAPGALQIAADALDGDPAAVVAFGYCDYIDTEGRRLWTSRAGRFAPWLMTWGPDLVPQPGSLFRLSAVQKVGGVDETLCYAMDLDLLLRLRREGTFVNTRRTLSSFRWHPTSLVVANRSPSLAESERVKRRHLSATQRRVAVLWERPVRGATRLAARRLNRLAGRLGETAG